MPNLVENVCKICNSKFLVEYKKRNKATCGKECGYAFRSLQRKESRESDVGIQKKCPDCGFSFLDNTRRQTMQRCSLCTTSKMVKTRKDGGTYVQSEERRKWQSEMMKRKYEEGWNPNTDDHRKKLSRIMKEKWSSGKMKREGLHWTQTEEGKRRLSQKAKGRKLSKEACKKMSIAAAERILKGKRLRHRGRGGIREDLGFYVRSSWEANFARVLRYLQKEFEYEPEYFSLDNGKSYIPDFKVGDCFYEIKGYMSQASKEKIELFKQKFPQIDLKIIGPVEYNELYQTYGGFVNWE